SVVDADDAVQETMIRAWRGLERFEGRSSLRRWLVRIATNVCLDQLGARGRRVRPFEDGPCGGIDGDLGTHPGEYWLEPIPDALVLTDDADPAERAALRQSIRLAFVAALQHLPPRQRACLLLKEVLDFSAEEIAETLETSVASVNSALQRARAQTMASRREQVPAFDDFVPTTGTESLLERYIAAFERHDVDALVGLLCDDVIMSMPPYTLWLQGPATIHDWLHGPGIHCRGSRLLPVAASASPAFAQYRPAPEGGHRAWALIVLELREERIAAWNAFLAVETLFPRFGLDLELPPQK
ncbi:MAG: sigma-70 family RNA polymerase sigma factor, partial [Myxococcales bacterium]|nr:sigma-70 family RNA polymerase sigma factor [Myxococcales bacterium]